MVKCIEAVGVSRNGRQAQAIDEYDTHDRRDAQ
jgi:hypothetical protein